MSDTPEHACIVQLHGLVRQVANPLETLMGIPARLQQAWMCPECGKTEWKDVPTVTVEETK